MENVSFVDDDDLQQALARNRNMQLRKRSRSTRKAADESEDDVPAANSAEAIARLIAQERHNHMDIQDGDDANDQLDLDALDDEDASRPLVISETTGFIRNLPTAPIQAKAQITTSAAEEHGKARESISIEESADAERDETMVMEEDEESEKVEAGKKAEEKVDEAALPFGKTLLVGKGLSATLALLKKSGTVTAKEISEEERQKKKQREEQRSWIAEQKRKDLLDRRDREKSREQEREQMVREGRTRDREWLARRALSVMLRLVGEIVNGPGKPRIDSKITNRM